MQGDLVMILVFAEDALVPRVIYLDREVSPPPLKLMAENSVIAGLLIL